MKGRHFIYIAFSVVALGAVFFGLQDRLGNFAVDLRATDQVAGLYFADVETVDGIRDRFDLANKGGKKIKIGIVAGHDDVNFGAEFGGLRESDATIEMAVKLNNYFLGDDRFETVMIRNKEGYGKDVLDYIERERANIDNFIDSSKVGMIDAIAKGEVVQTIGVPHSNAKSEVALRLYGINRWADENHFDILIHLHLNDYPGHGSKKEGKYSGFSIYVPDSQYGNAKVSRGIGEEIFKTVGKYFASSDLPREDAGVVDDQELIALGSNNTLKSASVLIEGGYIYESHFQNEEVRSAVLGELAWQIYRGVRSFFGEEKIFENGFDTTLLPLNLTQEYRKGVVQNMEILSVQMALASKGFYPPTGFTKNDCPMSGRFGRCTELALSAFQKKYGISETGDYLGPRTRLVLNNVFD